MCNTWSRIRMRIGFVLMPIRIRIGIGINMEIRIRIHNTAFFKRTGPEGPCPQHPSMKLNLPQPSLVNIQYVQTSKDLLPKIKLISPLWRIFIRSMSVQIWTRSPTENCNIPPCNLFNDIDKTSIFEKARSAVRKRIQSWISMLGLGTSDPIPQHCLEQSIILKKTKCGEKFF